MSNNEQKCGLISLIGFPNSGKSTLVNNLVNSKISIISSKVQTTQKAIRVITGSAGFPAGAAVSLVTAQLQGGVQVDGAVVSAQNNGKNLEVFVNGQLLASGSNAQRVANPPTRDYEISGNSELKFAFDLEADDIVQVIKR